MDVLVTQISTSPTITSPSLALEISDLSSSATTTLATATAQQHHQQQEQQQQQQRQNQRSRSTSRNATTSNATTSTPPPSPPLSTSDATHKGAQDVAMDSHRQQFHNEQQTKNRQYPYQHHCLTSVEVSTAAAAAAAASYTSQELAIAYSMVTSSVREESGEGDSSPDLGSKSQGNLALRGRGDTQAVYIPYLYGQKK
jgi:hypothetical protein